MNETFEFTIYVAVILVGIMIATHRHFSDNVQRHLEQAKREWCECNAKSVVEEVKKTFKETEMPASEDIKKFYTNLYRNQLESAEILSDAEKPSRWLDFSLLCFVSAIILFFASGILSYTSVSEYSFPSLVLGCGSVVVAAIYLFKIEKEIR